MAPEVVEIKDGRGESVRGPEIAQKTVSNSVPIKALRVEVVLILSLFYYLAFQSAPLISKIFSGYFGRIDDLLHEKERVLLCWINIGLVAVMLPNGVPKGSRSKQQRNC